MPNGIEERHNIPVYESERKMGTHFSFPSLSTAVHRLGFNTIKYGV